MFWLLISLISSSALQATYLNFNAVSNSANSTIQLTFGPGTDISYSVEFWMRPNFVGSSISGLTVVSNPNDWNALYFIQDQSLTFTNIAGSDYCRVSSVPQNLWSHIAFVYNKATTTITCYLNGTTMPVIPNPQTSNKSPSALYIGQNFYGNVYDLRAWVTAIGPYDVYNNYTTYLAKPWPSNLNKYFRLIPGSTTSTIQEYIGGTYQALPSALKSPWITESQGSLILCAPGNYSISGNCAICPSTCALCKSSSISTCFKTARQFIDFSNPALTETISFTYVSTTNTIEFWFYSLAWNTNLELISVSGVIQIKQRGSASLVSFYDGAGIEAFNFPASINTWYHVSWVYSGGKASIYINNATNSGFVWNLLPAGKSIYIGSNSTTRFQGYITDLRLWSSSRTATEVLAGTNSLFWPLPSDIAKYIPLNETGTTLKTYGGTSSLFLFQTLATVWVAQDCTRQNCMFECLPLYYLDLGTGVCTKCDSSCQACNGPTSLNCTVCLTNQYTTPGVNSCYNTCPSGYVLQGTYCLQSCYSGYFSNSGVCTQCNSNCSTCSAANTCTACQPGYTFYPNLLTNNCIQNCNSNYFMNASLVCYPCNASCASCSGLANNCTSCPNGQYLYNSNCVNSCPNNTYNISTNCYNCDPSCLNCTGPSNYNCGVCKANYTYTDNLGGCFSVCPYYYLQDLKRCVNTCPYNRYALANNSCGLCDKNCTSCNGPLSSNCTLCGTNFLYNGSCYQNCPSHAYAIGQTCYECDWTCGTCEGESLNCTSCSALAPYSYFETNLCYSTCPNTTYTLQNNMWCVDSCPNNYYTNGSNCYPCSVNCSQCAYNSTFCTACPLDKYLLNNTCVIACPNGYYPNGPYCSQCSSVCSSCSSLNFCTACSNTSFYLDSSTGTCNKTCNTSTYISTNACVSSCLSGFYPTQNPKMCNLCPQGCSACSSSSFCTLCAPGYYLANNMCYTSCPPGTYSSNVQNTCFNCDPACAICTGSTLANCSVCTSNKIVYIDPTGNGNCVSACPAGFYQSGTMCSKCNSVCNTCYNSQSCSSCSKGLYLRNDYSCGRTCFGGDLTNYTNNTCVSFTSVYPTGQVTITSFDYIQLNYPINIVAGTGIISFYSVFNNTYKPAATIDINQNSAIVGNSLQIFVSAISLAYNSLYTIQVPAGVVLTASGNSTAIQPGLWNFTTAPYKFLNLVAIINDGSPGLELVSGTSLVLNAQKSYDPSSGFSVSPLTSTWSCLDYSTNYAKYNRGFTTSWSDYITNIADNNPSSSSCSFWPSVNGTNTQVLNVLGLTSVNSVYKFIYTIADPVNNRTTTQRVYVLIVPSNYKPVLFSGIPVYQVCVDKPLQLVAANPDTSASAHYSWTWTSTGTSSPVFLTPPNSWVISIEAGSLAPQTSYTFSLGYSDTLTSSFAVVTIQTNSPPTGGTIIADKLTGTSIIDTFTVQMPNWVDSDLPLYFIYYMKIDDDDLEYLIAIEENGSSFESFYPTGTITVIGYCYDTLGSRSQAQLKLEVVSLNDPNQFRTQILTLSNTVNSFSIYTNIDNVNTYAIELNAGYIDTNSIISYKLQLLNTVIQGKNYADTTFNANQDYHCLYMYYGLIGNLENLAIGPVNSAILEKIVKIFNSIDYSILQMNQIIYPISNSTIDAESPQYVFRPSELDNLSSMMANIIEVVYTNPNSSVTTGNLTLMLSNLNTVAALGTLVTEYSKILDLSSINLQTTKDLVSNLENTVFDLEPGVSVSVPSSLSSSINTTSVTLTTALVNSNPYNDGTKVLDQYLLIELKDVNNVNIIPVTNLTKPFVMTFNMSRNTFNSICQEIMQAQGDSVNIWPECTYWEEASSTWASSGCSLSNLGDIYSYFEFQSIPDYIPIVCECNHLTQFSVSFFSSQQISANSFVIHKENFAVFSTTTWETSVVLYLMIAGLITFIVVMSMAYYWDRYNPGLVASSVETEKTFEYWDPSKVESVLMQLEKEFIRTLTDEGDSKKDTRASLSKIINSGLVNKLMVENQRESKEIFEEDNRRTKPHVVEVLMKNNEEDENIRQKTKKHLEKGLNDPSLLPLNVSEPKARGNSSRKDLENTVASLKLHMNQLETGAHTKSSVDLFLEKFDDAEKLPPALRSKFKLENRELKKSNLKELGISPIELQALKFSKTGKAVADTTNLTGGKYCNL